MNIYNLTFNVLFLFVLGTSIYFYIEIYVKGKKRELLFIESAATTLNLTKDVYTDIFRINPNVYNTNSAKFLITVEDSTSTNYVDFRVIDGTGVVLSHIVRITSYFQTEVPFNVRNTSLDYKLQYKSSQEWAEADLDDAPSLIRLEIEY